MTKQTSVLAAVASVMVVGVFTQAPLAQNRNPKDEQKRQKEMQEAIQREARPLLIVVNEWQKAQTAGEPQVLTVNPKEADPVKGITAGAPALDPKSVSFRYDLMKALDGKVYAPYTLAIPTEAVGSGPVSLYIRVVEKGSTPPADPKAAKPIPFEDFYTVEPRAAAGQPARIMRAISAPPGEYDVYFTVRPKMADPKKNQNDPVKVFAVKQAATLANYWNGELTTSTIVVAPKVEMLQSQPSPEMQRERPYLFGQTEFVPSADNKFKKTDELNVVFQIYNPGLDAGQPNVTIEYSFHQKLPEGEKYFNKTSPQQMNGQSLPPGLDVAATQMLPGGQAVPLASFPVGDYRMEIKITDVVTKKSITRDVLFSVVGA